MYSSSGIKSSTAGVENFLSFIALKDFVSPMDKVATRSVVDPGLLFLDGATFVDFPIFILHDVHIIFSSHTSAIRPAVPYVANKIAYSVSNPKGVTMYFALSSRSMIKY